jgi:hypothetical protein
LVFEANKVKKDKNKRLKFYIFIRKMSYIEKKYNKKIKEIFEGLIESEEKLLELIKYKSFNKVDEIAKVLAGVNKRINLILKKYYPEIKDLNQKLDIKATMKFYYDLLHNLTDFVRHVENFQKIDDQYYDSLIDFIEKKDDLIRNKYRDIVSRELTNFYDKKSRDHLEQVLASKLQLRDRQFFTFGSLEEEIKKIAKLNGAETVTFQKVDNNSLSKTEKTNLETVITCKISERNDSKQLEKINLIIKNYLEAKDYEAKIEADFIITTAKLVK